MTGARHCRTTGRERATEIGSSLHVVGIKRRRVPRVVLLRRFEVVARESQVAGKNVDDETAAHEHLAERHYVVIVDRDWCGTAAQQDRLAFLPVPAEVTDVIVVDIDVATVNPNATYCALLGGVDPAVIYLDVVRRICARTFQFVADLDHRAAVGDAAPLAHVEAGESPVVSIVAGG